MKRLLKKLIPPLLVDYAKKTMGYSQWSGNFQSWGEAAALCTGYSEKEILDKLIHSQREVSEGRASFERDTVLFYKEVFNLPLIASIGMAAENQLISIVDFGGALGSAYFQNKKHIQKLISKWVVVEQLNFVNIGKKEFQNETLVFSENLKNAVQDTNPQILFSSSTLQYLEKPFEMIEEFTSLDAPYILLDRISFHHSTKSRLTIQKVPVEIYKASYPCWFFCEKDFVRAFEKKYELIWEFNGEDRADIPSYYKGFFFKRKRLVV